jgi:hypothetical protein
MFKSAAKALAGIEDDEPKPRRKTGETDRGLGRYNRLHAHRAMEMGQLGGRYDGLKVPPQAGQQRGDATHAAFGAAARAAVRYVARIPAAFYEAAADHLWDALEMMRFYGSDDMDDGGLDDDYDTQQDYHFPQP